MKPRPVSSRHRATRLGPGRCARRGPPARRRCRSARWPSGCRAWRPARRPPATTNAAVVEMLKRRAPAAGAAGVDAGRRWAASTRLGAGAHGRGQPGQLVGGLALGPQGHRKPADLRVAGLAGHDRVEGRRGAVAAEVLAGQRGGRWRRGRPAEGTGRTSLGREAEEVAEQRLARPVRIDSGWNCTPSTGSVAVAQAHHHVVVAPRRDSRSGGSVAGRPPASGSAWPSNGSRARRRSSARRGGCALVLPWTGSRPRTTRRRRPGRSPGGPGTRRGSARAAPSPRIASTEMPAWSGVPGPGEITMRSGAAPPRPATSIASLRRDLHLGAQLAQVLDQVVGEAVVVVDHERPVASAPHQSASAGGDLDGAGRARPPCSRSPRTPPRARSRPRSRRRPARGPPRPGRRWCGS